MNRRRRMAAFLAMTLVLILAGASAEARPRIGFLTLSAQQEGASLVAAFVDGLRRLGYAPGQNIDIDYLSLLKINVTMDWVASGSMQPRRLDAHSDGADRQPPGRR